METESQKEKVVYTKEELAARVRVPSAVEQDLKRIISDRLEQCGLYFRVFSRIKTAASMAKKFELKAYGEDHKLQDLVGVRINLYFADDENICRDIIEKTFEVLEWSASERSEDEFKPTKLNGVCRLPEYLKSEISASTWDMCIDDTFEIQIKTMFFEGWHEIEHDMRYKGEELWKDYSGFSRFFNSILATLELCDKSMISLFEDLGHELYKSGNWTDMIRSHFRLKMGYTPMYPEVEKVLDEDQQESVDSIAKRIYKTSKPVLISLILKKSKHIPINVNTIVAILNEGIFHDSRLSAIFKEMDVYNDGRSETVGESRHYELRPLVGYDVFRMKVHVDGNRIKNESERVPEVIFRRSADSIYRWIANKYSDLFTEMPDDTCSFTATIPGYHVDIRIDDVHLQMTARVRHVDFETGGRIWYTVAKLSKDEKERIILNVRNGFSEPMRDDPTSNNTAMLFSYPGYYKAIVDSVGVFSGIDTYNRRRILRDDQVAQLCAAIDDPENVFPIVLIISGKTENPDTGEVLMDENWLNQLRVSDFTRTVWRYAHIFTGYEENGRKVLQMRGIEPPGGQASEKIYVFWPGGNREYDCYGPEDIANCRFGRHLEVRDDTRTYDIVRGGQAFYHKLVTDLRDWNVSSLPVDELQT